MPSTEPAIRCVSLVKVYDTPSGRVQAVRGVDLDIESGSTTVVVGPSGSGKSSLLRMLAGLDQPTAGAAYISGVDLLMARPGRRARLRRRLVSHVYQKPSDNLLQHLTARQQLLRIAHRRVRSTNTVDEALESLGIAHRQDHVPAEMSGGEQQRLAFARAVVGGQRVVIADEPTATLDTASTDTVLDAIQLLAERGTTVLIATHDPRVMRRSERIVTLRDGAIASITEAGSETAIIDSSGRLQLPPDVQAHFPSQRAVLRWDDTTGHLSVEPPP